MVLGTWLLVAPNSLLVGLGLPETDEIWIRVVGILAVILSLFFYDASTNEARSFFVASVLARLFSAAAYVAFWITGEPWQLVVFGLIDALGAAWTYTTLRDRRPAV